MPQEDYVYLGDTAMFPYGQRDPEELRRRIALIAEKLLERGAKLLVIACNTATAIGEDVACEVAAEYGVEVVPVVAPQAEIAAAITESGRVGVLATTNTVESGAYRRALEAQGRALDVIEVAAPRLAPFIQEGSLFDEETMEMARDYCAPLREAGVDTLILGCTHYPAGGADAAADPRSERAAGQRRPRGRGGDPAHAGQRGAWRARVTRRATTSSSAPARSPRSATSPPASSRCPSARSARSNSPCPPNRAGRIGTKNLHSARHVCAFPCQGSVMATFTSGNTVYPLKWPRFLISIPDDLLGRIDEFAKRSAETRSGFLQRLAKREIAADNARRRKEFEQLLGPPLKLGGDSARRIREERDSDHWR